MMRRIAMPIIFSLALFAQDPDAPRAVFGTTVVIPAGLEGKIYYLKRNAQKLPNFKKMKSVGSIYTTKLNIPTQNFLQGFPGVTDRFEWFAIDYTGRFWAETPGYYDFSLLSDDGSKLYIDGNMVIDNDRIHWAKKQEGSAQLTHGVHDIRVSYFQGPGNQIALVLKVALPGGKLRVFNTDELKPPPTP